MAVDHNGRACLRETARNGCANVLSRSGNDRDTSVEVCLVDGRHQRAPLLGLDILRYSMREHRIRRRTGSKPESSMRAYVFRFAPESGRRATWSACPFRVKFGNAVPVSLVLFNLRS